MLIGYPVNYRNVEDIADSIKPFGRLMFWQRDNVLERIIIKATVTELTEVPHYIVISEGDDHEGISLTAQCEIIQQNLMGGPLQDEDFPPGGPGDDFIPPSLHGNQVQAQVEEPFPPPQPLEMPNIPDLNDQPNKNIPEPALPNGNIVNPDAVMEEAAEINQEVHIPIEINIMNA